MLTQQQNLAYQLLLWIQYAYKLPSGFSQLVGWACQSDIAWPSVTSAGIFENESLCTSAELKDILDDCQHHWNGRNRHRRNIQSDIQTPLIVLLKIPFNCDWKWERYRNDIVGCEWCLPYLWHLKLRIYTWDGWWYSTILRCNSRRIT